MPCLPPRFPLLLPALASLFGILAAAVLPAFAWMTLAFLASTNLLYLRKPDRTWPTLACLLILLISISALRQQWHLLQQGNHKATVEKHAGERLHLSGNVLASSQGQFPHWIEIRTQLANSGNGKLNIRIELPMPPCPSWVIGTHLQAHGTLRMAENARNPGQWDPKRYFQSRQINGLLDSHTMPTLVREAPWWSPRAVAAHSRRQLLQHMREHGPDSRTAAIMQGVLLGDRSGFPVETLDDFRFSGTLHLFAVSGLHVGMVGGFFWLILRFAGCPRRLAILFLIPGIWCYTLLAGSTPSSVRAATMMSFFLVGPLINRRAYAINSLAAAFLALIWINPGQLNRVGFQLTFGVLAALLSIGTLLRRTWWHRIHPDPFFPQDLIPAGELRRVRLTKGFAGALTTSIAATLGAMPLSIWHFNLASPVAIPLNLALIPMAGMVLLLGFAGLAIGLIAPPLATLTLKPAAWSCALMAWLSHQGAALPYGHFHLHRPPPEECEIIVYDMNWGGGSTLIRHRGAAPWLIDTGNQQNTHSIILKSLIHFGEPPPSHLWLTHRDSQHIGGAAFLATQFPQLQITPYHTSGDQGFLPHTTLASHQNTSIHALFPPPEWTTGRANDRCLVLLVKHGTMRILILNDAGFLPQAWLMENLANEIQCDVLVCGWANDDIALTRTFVEASGARLVILPRPYYRSYHQPDTSFLSSLASPERQIWSQSSTGAVHLHLRKDSLTAISHLENHHLHLPTATHPPP